MYYESNLVEDILKCSFCREKFTNMVKLIPECGNSICGTCYGKLRTTLDASDQYQCLECKESHTMLKNGLGDNKGLLKMLQLETKEKALNNKEKMLKGLIDGLQEKVKKLKSLDEGEEINSHCDELAKEVTEAVESAIKHLNKLGGELLEQINRFRSEALNARKEASPNDGAQQPNKRFKKADETPTRSHSQTSSNGSGSGGSGSGGGGSKKQHEVDALSTEIDAFSKDWSEFFTQITKTATEEAMEKAQCQVRDYEVKIRELEAQIRGEVFKKRVLRFQINSQFYQSHEHIGELIHDYPSQEAVSSSSNRGVDKNKVSFNVVHTLSGHFNWVRQVLFLANGYVASCSDDFTIKIWNVETGKMYCELKSHTKCFFALAQLANGWLAGGSDNYLIKIWDITERKTKRTLFGHSDSILALQVLGNGHLASASLDDTIKIWNPLVEEGNLLVTMSGHGAQYVPHMKLLSNGNLVTCSSSLRGSDCIIRTWSPTEGRMVKALSTYTNDANVLLVLSNDRVAISFKDGTIKLFNLDEMRSRLLIRHHKGGFFSMIELPSGHLMTGGQKYDPTLRIWSMDDGELLHTVHIGHIHCISSMSVSKDGKYLATGSYDRAVKILSLTY